MTPRKILLNLGHQEV